MDNIDLIQTESILGNLVINNILLGQAKEIGFHQSHKKKKKKETRLLWFFSTDQPFLLPGDHRASRN